MSNYKVQELELNTYCKTYLAPSDIDGIGVFALRTIPKGQKLYTDIIPKVYNLPFKAFNNLFLDIRKLLLGQFPQIVNGSAFAYPTVRIQAYVNHSDTPNYDAVKAVVLKTIRKGQEITEDYRKIENHKKVFDFLNK